MNSFRRYRQMRGGKWGRVTGWLWGKRWVKLPADSPMWDENWN